MAIPASAQNVFTWAGGGPVNYADPLQTPLPIAAGLVRDAAGNLYVSTMSGSRVYRVDTQGRMTIFAGATRGIYSVVQGDGLPATAAPLMEPNALAFDNEGRLLIAAANHVRRVSGDGIVSTIAGNTGLPGFSGDNGAATAARFAFSSTVFGSTQPITLSARSGLAVSSAGDIFIADANNHRIRRIDPANGNITTYAGSSSSGSFSGDNGPATQATLNVPRGLWWTAQGLYVADSTNHRIRFINNAGVITTIAGTGVPGSAGDGGLAVNAQLLAPMGVALDAQGRIYVAEANRIRRIDNGVITTVAGGGSSTLDGVPATTAAIIPSAVIPEPAGGFVLADTAGLKRVSAGGIISTVVGTRSLFETCGDGMPAVTACLSPTDIAAHQGAVYIVDRDSNRVRVVRDGVIRTIAGGGWANPGDGGPATSASLFPSAIALFGSRLYIVEQSFHRVRQVDLNTGVIATIAGIGFPGFSGDNGPAVQARLSNPASVGVDSNGIVYIADRDNHRIRRISSGEISTFAGIGTSGQTGDGGLATAAQLTSPQVVRVAGNRFLIASGDRIREVNLLNNLITTIAGGGLFSEQGAPVTGVVSAIVVDAGGVVHFSDWLPNETLGVNVFRLWRGQGGNLAALTGGAWGLAGEGQTAGAAPVSSILGIAFDANGNVLFSDSDNGRVRRIGVAQSCLFTLSKPGASIGASGDLVQVTLTASAPDCVWTTTTNRGWLRVVSPAPWAGSGIVRFTAEANSGPARTATLTMGDVPFEVTQAEAGCSFSMMPQTIVMSAAGAASTFQVATAPNCTWWPAVSPTFLNIATGTAPRQGTRTLDYTVAPNTSAVPRTGSISAGGQTLLVLQRGSGTPQLFTDVPPAYLFFEHITLLRQANVTLGCGLAIFCPEDATTRGQMAAFIIRALYGENFTYPEQPFFADVPATHTFFRHIQKLREVGITAGCTTTTYCPDDVVTRGQMAAFLIRARLGVRASQTFPFNPTAFFSDVPNTHPFFNYIQKLKELGVTAGCDVNLYCPESATLRGQMAAFLIRNFFTP